MIRVLVAEDSRAAMEHLVQILEADPALQVVGRARTGGEAVELVAKLRPDVIVMDVELPRMDGLEATRRIMTSLPRPIVLVTAHSDELEAKAFEALEAGALTVLDKPRAPGRRNAAGAEAQLVATVKLMSEVKVVRRWPARNDRRWPQKPAVSARPKVRIVALGASAGGPPAVAEILTRLPGGLSCPVLLVQHIAPGFAASFADWLDRSTTLTVKLAGQDERLLPGTVYVAPDGAQMGVSSTGRIRLTDEVSVDGFRPSASYLLRSVARAYGRAAIGVLLTGMGRDGAAGLLELRRAGGVTIAQDRESSVVFGMPGEAIRLGAAEHVLRPAQIAETIAALVGEGEA